MTPVLSRESSLRLGPNSPQHPETPDQRGTSHHPVRVILDPAKNQPNRPVTPGLPALVGVLAAKNREREGWPGPENAGRTSRKLAADGGAR